jgi:hypothetical protein
MSQKYGAKGHIFDTLLRLHSLSFFHPPDLAADIGFDNLLTPTLKSDMKIRNRTILPIGLALVIV